jgi:hypothetical protein
VGHGFENVRFEVVLVKKLAFTKIKKYKNKKLKLKLKLKKNKKNKKRK